MLHKIAGLATAGVLILSTATAGAADRPLTVQDEVTRTECGDCHMVFPPAHLTGKAWSKIMATLEDHFGEDASLDAESIKHIEAYLVSKSLDAKGGIRTEMRLKAWAKKGIVDPLRITETPEWTRHHTKKHRYKLMAADVGYTRGSNCTQCHKDAETGLYEEFEGQYGDRGGDD